VLGETNFNIGKFYGHKQQRLSLPVRDDFFTLNCLISVVELTQGASVGVDVEQILNMEDPNRTKKVTHHDREIIRSQSGMHSGS
jgi:hypothetical protein